jgi:hypothetical protein
MPADPPIQISPDAMAEGRPRRWWSQRKTVRCAARAKLRDAGVPNELVRWAEVNHGFFFWVGMVDGAARSDERDLRGAVGDVHARAGPRRANLLMSTPVVACHRPVIACMITLRL